MLFSFCIQKVNIEGNVFLFSSPKKEKWSIHNVSKTDFFSIGFIMETWTKEEFEFVEENKYPRKLCEDGSTSEDELGRKLDSLDIKKRPSEINRVDLFGMQPRYELTNSETMIKARLNEILDELEKIEELDFTISKYLNHRFISTEYDVDTNTVYNKYISPLVHDIIMKKVQTKSINFVEILFDKSPPLCKGGFFKIFARTKFSSGFNGCVKFDSQIKNENVHFSSISIREIFYPQIHCFIQMLYKDEQVMQLLGSDAVSQPTYYTPLTHKTFGFDDILIVPPKISGGYIPIYHVMFMQITTGPSHDITPSSFFGMLWVIIAVSLLNKCVVIPWFLFFVPFNSLNTFKVMEPEYLKCYFKHIHILIIVENPNQSKDFKTDFFDLLSNKFVIKKKKPKEIKKEENQHNETEIIANKEKSEEKTAKMVREKKEHEKKKKKKK
jgi:hypothetical protein